MPKNKNCMTINGKEYELVFTVGAYVEVIETYGGLQELSNIFQDTKKSVREIANMALIMANQGILIDNMLTGRKTPLLTSEAMFLKSRPGAFRAAKGAILNAINDGMKATETEDEEIDEVLEDEKNGKGAGDH